eukprot:SAG22_NODE_1074_length_5688_cov_92.719449_6_plen_343_part_00
MIAVFSQVWGGRQERYNHCAALTKLLLGGHASKLWGDPSQTPHIFHAVHEMWQLADAGGTLDELAEVGDKKFSRLQQNMGKLAAIYMQLNQHGGGGGGGAAPAVSFGEALWVGLRIGGQCVAYQDAPPAYSYPGDETKTFLADRAREQFDAVCNVSADADTVGSFNGTDRFAAAAGGRADCLQHCRVLADRFHACSSDCAGASALDEGCLACEGAVRGCAETHCGLHCRDLTGMERCDVVAEEPGVTGGGGGGGGGAGPQLLAVGDTVWNSEFGTAGVVRWVSVALDLYKVLEGPPGEPPGGGGGGGGGGGALRFASRGQLELLRKDRGGGSGAAAADGKEL